MKILEKLNEDYLNNVDFIYIYKHGAKVIKFDLRDVYKRQQILFLVILFIWVFVQVVKLNKLSHI